MALELYADYRSDFCQLGRELHARLLRSCLLYQRAVGFFASSVFAALSTPLLTFFSSGGHMELVCSENVSPADAQALVRVVCERPAVRRWWRSLEDAFASGNGPSILSYLVSRDYLRLKVALLSPPVPDRMYHEKLAVFRDEVGQLVALSGSANESAAALLQNFERLDVFWSWGGEDEKRRAVRIAQQFREVWENRSGFAGDQIRFAACPHHHSPSVHSGQAAGHQAHPRDGPSGSP